MWASPEEVRWVSVLELFDVDNAFGAGAAIFLDSSADGVLVKLVCSGSTKEFTVSMSSRLKPHGLSGSGCCRDDRRTKFDELLEVRVLAIRATEPADLAGMRRRLPSRLRPVPRDGSIAVSASSVVLAEESDDGDRSF